MRPVAIVRPARAVSGVVLTQLGRAEVALAPPNCGPYRLSTTAFVLLWYRVV